MSFRIYYHNKIYSHTIPKSIVLTQRIVSYLRSRITANEKDIADALEVKLEDVLDVLSRLEKKRIVERVSSKNR